MSLYAEPEPPAVTATTVTPGKRFLSALPRWPNILANAIGLPRGIGADILYAITGWGLAAVALFLILRKLRKP